MIHLLIVDDDLDAARTLGALVRNAQTSVALASSLLEARKQIALHPPDIILLDLMLPDGSGMSLFDDPALLQRAEVILVTGHASLETSIQALRLGAADYLVKPIQPEHLQRVLSRFIQPAAMQAEMAGRRTAVGKNGNFGLLWGRSAPMRAVYEQISRVAATGVPVFITGESGTGKELVAQTVHDLSRRRKQPFLAVNCGAISPQLFESEIFGHERGSFTGAERQHAGFFERASGGTLFLDEVTEMPQALQVKLLRVLETGRFTRVGSTTAIDCDVRLIAASNRSLTHAVATGSLREDLMYRLNVFPIEMPPLRARLDDVPLLANHFLAAMCETEGTHKRFTDAALQHMARCRWPGNVRELRNAVQRAFVMSAGEWIDQDWLPAADPPAPAPALAPAASPPAWDRLAPAAEAPAAATPLMTFAIGSPVAEVERRVILATLAHYNHRKEHVAAVLGISLKTLYNRLKDYTATADDLRDS